MPDSLVFRDKNYRVQFDAFHYEDVGKQLYRRVNDAGRSSQMDVPLRGLYTFFAAHAFRRHLRIITHLKTLDASRLPS